MVTGNIVYGQLGQLGNANAMTAATTATVTTNGNYAGMMGQQIYQYAQGLQATQQQQLQQAALEYYAFNERYAQDARAADEALQRSKELFEHHLTEEQLKDYRKTGFITVRGGFSGADYRIHVAAKSYNITGKVVLVAKNGRWSVDKIGMFKSLTPIAMCCAPNGLSPLTHRFMPMFDTVLGQKLALELDELAFIEKANVSRSN